MSKTQKPKVSYPRYTKQVVNQPLIVDGVQKRNENGDYLSVRITTTYGYDSILRRWVKVDVKKETLLPQQLGLTQHAKQKVVFQREGLNDLLEKVYKFFIIECSVDFKETNKHEWISVSNGSFWLHNLQHGRVGKLSFSSQFVKKSEPKPISERKVLAMLKSKEIAHVYNDEKLREVYLFHRIVSEA
jgi:hypothetical protein